MLRRAFSAAVAPKNAYPYPLFWTAKEAQAPFALSFKNASPSLPPAAVIGWVSGPANTLPTPSNFRANPWFEDALHEFLGATLHSDVGWRAMAAHQKFGYMTITDARVYTPWGRVADPEDILGAVLLQDGEIVPGTYQRMPSHRLVSTNGLMQLSEFLHDRFLQFDFK